jgi:hypothetical protein
MDVKEGTRTLAERKNEAILDSMERHQYNVSAVSEEFKEPNALGVTY